MPSDTTWATVVHQLGSKGVTLAKVSQEEIQEMIANGTIQPMLTESEWLLAKRYRTLTRKLSWLGGQVAAKRAVSLACGAAAPDAVTVGRTAGGAPVAQNYPAFSVSITHTGPLAVAAVTKGRVGVDSETITDRPESFIKLWLTHAEKSTLSSLALCDRSEYVNRCWTIKEAFSKVYKMGGMLPFNKICSEKVVAGQLFNSASFVQQHVVISLLWTSKETVCYG